MWVIDLILLIVIAVLLFLLFCKKEPPQEEKPKEEVVETKIEMMDKFTQTEDLKENEKVEKNSQNITNEVLQEIDNISLSDIKDSDSLDLEEEFKKNQVNESSPEVTNLPSDKSTDIFASIPFTEEQGEKFIEKINKDLNETKEISELGDEESAIFDDELIEHFKVENEFHNLLEQTENQEPDGTEEVTTEREVNLTKTQISIIEKQMKDEKTISVDITGKHSKSDSALDYFTKQKNWNKRIKEISKRINDLSSGNIKTVNNAFLDRLIEIRGKNRPIAVFVKPISSNLSHGGAFIYDTRKIKDKSLYLFIGNKCPMFLQRNAKALLELMDSLERAKHVFYINKDYECKEFRRMIHTIGGHIDQIQSPKSAGDEFLFEHCFYKTNLHIVIFSEGKPQALAFKSNQASIADLPQKGACVIDTSDLALYLYIPNPHSKDDDEKEDVLASVQWIASQREYKGREVTIFQSSSIPPNIAVIFGITKI